MSSDELSFEELSQAFARAIRGNAVKNESFEPEGRASSGGDELVDIPDEFFGEDFPDDIFEDPLDDDEENGEFEDPEEEDGQQSASDAFRSMMDEIDDDQLVPLNPRTILEAMLFVGNPANSPIMPETLSNLMRGVSVSEIHELAEELNTHYLQTGCPWEIVWFEEAHGYFMQLREEFTPLRENFYGKIRQVKLSQSAIDTLAIVAYEQPLSLEEINQLRGTPSGPILAQLVKRQLLRTQKIRRGTKFMTVYSTTERFLKLFELESISDLPQSDDLAYE